MLLWQTAEAQGAAEKWFSAWIRIEEDKRGVSISETPLLSSMAVSTDVQL